MLRIFEKNIFLLKKDAVFANATYKKYTKKHKSLRLKCAFLQVMYIFYIKIANFLLKYIYIIVNT